MDQAFPEVDLEAGTLKSQWSLPGPIRPQRAPRDRSGWNPLVNAASTPAFNLVTGWLGHIPSPDAPGFGRLVVGVPAVWGCVPDDDLGKDGDS